MILILVRHGEAVSEQVDPQKPLSVKGRAEVEKVARFLQQARLRIEIFIHSGKTRAKETAQIIRELVNPQAALQAKDYLSPNDSLDRILLDIEQNQKNILIAGHMPFLSLLTSQLLVGDEEKLRTAFSTGTAAILERDSARQWQLVGLINPGLL